MATSKASTPTEDAPVEPVAEAKPATKAAKVKAGECVVDDGTPHTGRAVNGLICSRHAINYRADGTPR
jgi:hypothetical protein